MTEENKPQPYTPDFAMMPPMGGSSQRVRMKYFKNSPMVAEVNPPGEDCYVMVAETASPYRLWSPATSKLGGGKVLFLSNWPNSDDPITRLYREGDGGQSFYDHKPRPWNIRPSMLHRNFIFTDEECNFADYPERKPLTPEQVAKYSEAMATMKAMVGPSTVTLPSESRRAANSPIQAESARLGAMMMGMADEVYSGRHDPGPAFDLNVGVGKTLHMTHAKRRSQLNVLELIGTQFEEPPFSKHRSKRLWKKLRKKTKRPLYSKPKILSWHTEGLYDLMRLGVLKNKVLMGINEIKA